MTDTTVPQQAAKAPVLSSAGRRVRSAVFHVPPTDPNAMSPSLRDATATLSNVAKGLQQRLDAIAQDKLLTPSEKRSRSKAAVDEARKLFDGPAKTKAHDAALEVAGRMEQLDHLRRSYAAKVDTFTLRRLELRAEQLRTAGGDAVLAEWNAALASQDLDRVLALQLVDPGNAHRAERAFLAIARPDELKTFERDLAAARRVQADVEAFELGIAELARNDDAHLGAGASAEDLFALANRQGVPPSPTWPGWARAGGES